MAKRRPTSAQLAARKRAATAPRSPSGRFLSADALQARAREDLRRLVEAQFATPEQREKIKQSKARANQVKTEKVNRRKRFKKNRKAYQYKHKPDKVTLAQQDVINDGVIPKPAQKIARGELTEYVWTWQGPHALQTAQDLLLLLHEKGPSDLMGFLSLGTGHSLNSHWIGTKFGTPIAVWRQSQSTDFLRGKGSKNTVEIAEQLQTTVGGRSIWAEVSMTTKGAVNHATSRQKKRQTKSGSRATKRAKRFSKHSRKNTKRGKHPASKRKR